jgi:threonine/homoserine/homoserine lactone efflux protein
LSTASFIAAFKDGSDYSKQFQLKSSLSAFILGIALSAINPAQIPFWFGFSAVLQSKKILSPVRLHYGIYMSAIAIGSMLASFIFIYAGHFMIQGIGNNNFLINIIVSSCFGIAALVQLFRILYKKKTETNKVRVR